MRVTKRFHVEDLELNMTPMIDIVFLLIIFFLVVSEIASYDRIENLTLPVASEAMSEHKFPDRLIISVDTYNRIFIGGRERTMTEVGRLLKAEREIRRKNGGGEGKTKQPVLIQADHNAKWEVVRSIIEKANEFKFWRLSFSAKRKAD